MIASAFPPAGGGGVQRTAKFAKYLSRLGWRVHVWTTRGTAGLPVDESLPADLPADVCVHRRSAFDPLNPSEGDRTSTFARRLSATLRSALARSLPDERVWWAIGSAAPLRRLIRAHGIDVIYSTFSPPSNHLLASWLKRRTGRPWVADFRDLWTDDCVYRARGLRRFADRRLEARFLREADAVIGVSKPQTRLLARRCRSQAARFHTITNGFDPEDFADQLPSHAQPRPFVLAHAGSLSSMRVDDALIEGIAAFARTIAPNAGGGGDEGAAPFRFEVVGVMSSELHERFRAKGVPVAWSGYVNHAEAVRRMRAADLLLLPTAIGRHGDTLIPGKLFEYLASRRPILVTGDADSEVCRLVRRFGGGVTCERSAEAIHSALTALYAARSCDPRPYADLSIFSREKLAQRLSDVLISVCRAAGDQVAAADGGERASAQRARHVCRGSDAHGAGSSGGAFAPASENFEILHEVETERIDRPADLQPGPPARSGDPVRAGADVP